MASNYTVYTKAQADTTFVVAAQVGNANQPAKLNSNGMLDPADVATGALTNGYVPTVSNGQLVFSAQSGSGSGGTVTSGAITDATVTGKNLLTAPDAPTARTVLAAAGTASPQLSGTPTAPTPSQGDNSSKIATTAYVMAAIPPVVTLDNVPTDTVMGDGSMIAARKLNAGTSGAWAATGRWFPAPGSTVTTLQLAADTLYLLHVPWYLAHTFGNVGSLVTAPGTAAVLRWGIWRDAGDPTAPYPGQFIVEALSGALSVASISQAAAFTSSIDSYWFGVVAQGSTGTAAPTAYPTVNAVASSGASQAQFGSATAGAASTTTGMLYTTAGLSNGGKTLASLGATLPAGATKTAAAMPLTQVQA